MSRLVLLGGPVGVGKSTVLPLLDGRWTRMALLDADDVWRVSPDLAEAAPPGAAIDNVVAILRGYFDAGCAVAIVGWVFARPALYRPVMAGVQELVGATHQIYLVASPEALARRLSRRGHPERIPYALSRLDLIRQLPFPQIDTTAKPPPQVASLVQAVIDGSA